MKPLSEYTKQVSYSIRSTRRFFSTTLSSHIVPVIFAVGLLFITERKLSGNETATNQAKAETTMIATPTAAMVACAGVANINQLVGIYHVTGLLLKVVR
ncbi:MAG: hypothetical protein EOO94_02600 [Pedobacter sp.]|nr:MAG: hypothetical protein EOO94_02600 [Pedobacter sp.]